MNSQSLAVRIILAHGGHQLISGLHLTVFLSSCLLQHAGSSSSAVNLKVAGSEVFCLYPSVGLSFSFPSYQRMTCVHILVLEYKNAQAIKVMLLYKKMMR